MVKITYVHPDGTRDTVEGSEGDNVMYTAIANNIEGIVGECGGSMMCATCHCHVDDAWTETTGPRHEGEEDMLDCATSPMRDTSRLSCRIKLSPALDGLVVHLPEDQV